MENVISSTTYAGIFPIVPIYPLILRKNGMRVTIIKINRIPCNSQHIITLDPNMNPEGFMEIRTIISVM